MEDQTPVDYREWVQQELDPLAILDLIVFRPGEAFAYKGLARALAIQLVAASTRRPHKNKVVQATVSEDENMGHKGEKAYPWGQEEDGEGRKPTTT
jgi:hypothetical protein